MTHLDLIERAAHRINPEEADAFIAYVSKLDQDDVDYYADKGLDGLISSFRGEFVDYTKGTEFRIVKY